MSNDEECMQFDNASNDDDDEDLFADSDEDEGRRSDGPKPKKRRKVESNGASDKDNKDDANDGKTVLVEEAKKRLSKWAARLFDPDRPRGLVEPPQVIPLNDEFLTAFGKREKQFDKDSGREVEISTKIESDDENDGENEDENDGADKKKKKKASKKDKAGTKVKFTNLAYRTSGATLRTACEKYGPIVDVNMIIDKERQGGPNVFNSGRAYVRFELAESAEACVDGLKELDGRPLRLTIALEKPKSSNTAGSASLLNRYWDKDISTVCYRCGGIGHIEPNCTNPAKPKPCPLCGKLDHDIRACPCNRICFNCGAPGHVNRDCKQQRGMPKRIVCGICFQSGHHRLQCRSRPEHAASIRDSVCMICHQKGHFMCKEMKWFYGLQGQSCFNCGSQGHSGYDCQRPNLFMCLNDPMLMNQEIERAEACSVTEQLEQAMKQQRGRQMGRDNDRNRRKQFRSMPPQRQGGQKRGYSDGNNGRGYSQNSGGGGGRGGERRNSGGGRGGGNFRRNSSGGGGGGGGGRRRGYR